MKKIIGFLSLLMMLTLSCKEPVFLTDELPTDEVAIIDLAITENAVKGNNLSDRLPGGGIFSTLEDMLKFGSAVLNNAFISEASLALMFEIPNIENNGIPYGLGWYQYEEIPNYGTVYGHGGAQTGASTMFMMLPEQDFFVIVLTNTSKASEEVLKITSRLFEIAGS